ncbi:hypothetical protein GOODEAATRI_026608, partial [Goodea atripinnis]
GQSLTLFCLLDQDQADGSGKRRLDNGEVGRWKLTDDPPPKKKAPPSLEEAARGEGGHKRKKEKEQPLDSGPKKKKPKQEVGESNGPTSSSGGAAGGQQGSSSSSQPVGGSAGSAGAPSSAEQRSHHREKLERFKRMCLLERRPESSSSSSSSSESDSESDSDDSIRGEHGGGSSPSSSSPAPPPPVVYGNSSGSRVDRERSRSERERARRLAELGFSASEESEGEGGRGEEDREEEQAGDKPRKRGGGDISSRGRKSGLMDTEEEDVPTSERTRKNSTSLPPPSPLSSNQIPPSSLHDGFTGKQRSNGQEARNGRTRGGTGGGEKENASGLLTNHRHGGGGGVKGSRGNKVRNNSKNQNQRNSVSSSSTPTSNGGGVASSGLLMSAMAASPCSQPSRLAPRSQMMKRSPPAVPSPPRPVQMERHLVRPPPACPEPSCLLLDCGSAHIMTRDVWLRVFTYLSQRELCLCMRVCRTWSRWSVTCCDKRLWTQIDLSRQRSITPPMLSGIIRRLPVSLNLGYTNISKKQLMWLINRLPEWTLGDCALIGPSAHSESRAGRFQNVTELRLAGLDLTDTSSRLLVRHTPHLTRLDLNHCVNITDQTVRNLTVSPLRESLTHINLAESSRILSCILICSICNSRTCSCSQYSSHVPIGTSADESRFRTRIWKWQNGDY